MIKISILYQNNKNARFDRDYYINHHIPLAIKLLSPYSGFKGVSVECGLSGATPETEAAFSVMCHFVFNSNDDFIAAFLPHAATLQGDIINYTDIEPIIQISEILIYQ